jgi:hypothetical protein
MKPELFELFQIIAKQRLDIRTLRTRGRDSLPRCFCLGAAGHHEIRL